MESSMDEILDNGEDEAGWVENDSSLALVYTEWKYSLNIDAILCGVLACNLLSALILEILDIELGTLPEFDLILKMDQKRLGLILKELPKEF